MTEVSIRDLRNHGVDVIDRVERGEEVTITRSGKPVAELRPIGPQPTPTDVLRERWKHLPRVDPDKLRRDIDAIVDQHI
jgi:prevent-host-death family protein